VEDTATTKRCRQCGQEKSLDDFKSRRPGAGEFRERCEQCSVKNRERAKARYKDDEQFREHSKAMTREWNAANPERNRERSRAWQIGHKERKNATRRKAHARNPEAVATRRKAWLARNPGRNTSYNRKWLLGVTAEQFAEMLAEQDGLCEICRVSFPETPRLDHDHITMVIRDLLCDLCNRGLGHFLDSPELLRAAADYIERHRANPRTMTWSDPGRNAGKLAEPETTSSVA
jgi:hypothetical protein